MADISSLLKDKRLKELSAKVAGLLPSAVPEQQAVIGGSPGQELQTQKEAAMQVAKNIAFQGMGGQGQASNFGLGQQVAENVGMGETGQQVVGNVAQYGPVVANIAEALIGKAPSMSAVKQRGLGQNIINLESKTEKAAEKFGKVTAVDDRPLDKIAEDTNQLRDKIISTVRDNDVFERAVAGSADAVAEINKHKSIKRAFQRYMENKSTIDKVMKD